MLFGIGKAGLRKTVKLAILFLLSPSLPCQLTALALAALGSTVGHAVPLPEQLCWQLLPRTLDGTVESSTILEMSPAYESHKKFQAEKRKVY